MRDLVARTTRAVATSPPGRWVDRQCVEQTGHSPFVGLYGWATGMAYRPSLVLTTIGRRSGALHRVVLPWYDAGEGAVAVVGSKGGAPVDPDWVHNLRAEPRAWARVAGRERPVTGQVASGPERASLWAHIVDVYPLYEEYQAEAWPRELPVVVLAPFTRM